MDMNYKARPWNCELGAIRFDATRKQWWFMNHRCKGWASFGYCYNSMTDLLSRWDIRLAGIKRDKYGALWSFVLAES